MKKVKKVLIILIIVIAVLACLIYLDYFIAKTRGSSPKISLKEQLSDNGYVYKAVLYKVWYCETNKTYTFGDYSDKDAICPKNYSYVDGFYTNEQGVKISKKDLQLLTNDGIYTSDMIENMTSDKQVITAVSVANEYGKYKYEDIKEKSEDGYSLVKLFEFKEENDNYKWVINEEDVYCLKIEGNKKSLSKYENNKCEKFEIIKMSKEWCENYKSSTLVFEEEAKKLCEE